MNFRSIKSDKRDDNVITSYAFDGGTPTKDNFMLFGEFISKYEKPSTPKITDEEFIKFSKGATWMGANDKKYWTSYSAEESSGTSKIIKGLATSIVINENDDLKNRISKLQDTISELSDFTQKAHLLLLKFISNINRKETVGSAIDLIIELKNINNIK